MIRYYKRQWNESTGGELTDTWGTSMYYFETDQQLNVIRQIQVFEEGQVLKYTPENAEDEFGILSDQQLDNDEFEEFAITEVEFNNTWDKFGKTTI